MFIFGIIFSSMSFVSPIDSCNLEVSLINQDPYPAIPGEYVEVVFQIDGLANVNCDSVEFELLEKYPISFDPGVERKVFAESGIFQKDYSSFLLAPYKVRVDSNALEGKNPIEVQFQYGAGTGFETAQFDLDVEDTRVDFEVYVKDYDPSTGNLVLEVLNIAEGDIEALTIEIPKQENIEIKGSKANIVGDLDSNEYTTADFEAIPQEGEITIRLFYTDEINERRITEKTILFEPEYFQDRLSDQEKPQTGLYIVLLIIAVIIIYYFYKRRKKRMERQKRR